MQDRNNIHPYKSGVALCIQNVRLHVRMLVLIGPKSSPISSKGQELGQYHHLLGRTSLRTQAGSRPLATVNNLSWQPNHLVSNI